MTSGKTSSTSWLPVCLVVVGAAFWLPQMKVVTVNTLLGASKVSQYYLCNLSDVYVSCFPLDLQPTPGNFPLQDSTEMTTAWQLAAVAMTRVYYNGTIWTGNTEVQCMFAVRVTNLLSVNLSWKNV